MIPPEVAMAIRFRCDGCGRPFEVRDDLAGQTALCKQCGGRIQIPDPPGEVVFPDDLRADGPPDGPARGKGGWAARPAAAADPEGLFGGPIDPKPGPPARSSSAESGLKGVLGVLLVIGLIGLKVYSRNHQFGRARNAQQANARPNFAPMDAPPPLLDGRIALPSFPDPGPPREIEPGVMVREVRFVDPIDAPGHSGRLWVYTPAGDHPPRSLPCVLIAPAGSDLITGMAQAEGDRPEHLPYARAGFAVVAYELDGSVADPQEADGREMLRAARRFLRARAGLVNAHIALEYALARLPEVDPGRIAAAGHSSAGTMALLFAENEPRIRACVAYAPATDLPRRFGNQGVAILRQRGLGPLIERFSPSSGIAGLSCPLFLFHAQDDRNVPVDQSERFAEEARDAGKAVTLEVVPGGDHYDSMIRDGIPRGIEWLGKTLNPGPEANPPGPG
ncbi:alpha/beta hydrolase family protein [Tundrisphaera sp. TA3]|uniref:alpha/beta hydrolase family protein n=1 Tax=Tundrisphaera sp. TA3 TaxID=3435775 RepID=UPI003EB84F6E